MGKVSKNIKAKDLTKTFEFCCTCKRKKNKNTHTRGFWIGVCQFDNLKFHPICSEPASLPALEETKEAEDSYSFQMSGRNKTRSPFQNRKTSIFIIDFLCGTLFLFCILKWWLQFMRSEFHRICSTASVEIRNFQSFSSGSSSTEATLRRPSAQAFAFPVDQMPKYDRTVSPRLDAKNLTTKKKVLWLSNSYILYHIEIYLIVDQKRL